MFHKDGKVISIFLKSIKMNWIVWMKLELFSVGISNIILYQYKYLADEQFSKSNISIGFKILRL
ncbi:MAG TPA: hypothetical protein DCQ58_03740 [Saprospirales bacterium]|nr:hypothetical protein [Saprospirales bacterium]